MDRVFFALDALIIVTSPFKLIVVIWIFNRSLLPLLMSILLRSILLSMVILTNSAICSYTTSTACNWLLTLDSGWVSSTLILRSIVLAAAVGRFQAQRGRQPQAERPQHGALRSTQKDWEWQSGTLECDTACRERGAELPRGSRPLGAVCNIIGALTPLPSPLPCLFF